jgi:hypothetical protein
MKNLTTKFDINNIYEMKFIGDSDLRPQWICIKRTLKTVTMQRFQGSEKITRRIKQYNGCEYILEGSYSMAPSIYAKNIIA